MDKITRSKAMHRKSYAKEKPRIIKTPDVVRAKRVEFSQSILSYFATKPILVMNYKLD